MSMYVCVYVVQLLCFIAIIFVVLLNLLNCLSPTVSLLMSPGTGKFIIQIVHQIIKTK